MAQNVTIDTSAYSDAAILTEAKLDTVFAAVETVIEDVLNGVQAFDSILANATAEAASIVGGVATITRMYAELNAQSGTADDVDTITLTNGKFAFLRAASGDTITLKHGTGNITVDGGSDVVLTGNETALVFAAGSQVGVIGYGASGGGGITASSTDTLTNKTISASANTIGMGSGVTKTISNPGDAVAAGTDRNLIISANTGTSDTLIEVTGLAVGESVLLRATSGHTIAVTHNSGSATVKIHLHGDANLTLDEQNPLRLTLVATNVLVEDVQSTGGGLTKVVGTATYTPGANITTTSTTFTPIDSINIKVTVTLNGGGITFCFATLTANKLVAGNALFRWTDGTNNSDEDGFRFLTADDGHMTIIGVFNNLPAGSTTFTPQFRSSDGNTVQVIQNLPVTMRVVELS
jgi:hypothetical protein